jgi:hypothetical protein
MGHNDLAIVEEEPILDEVMREVGSLERVPDLEPEEVERLRQLYFARLDEVAAPGQRRAIDKLPLNILAAPLIHRLFPDATFILALRHPCDVALSCFMQDFEINDAMANFLELGTTARLYDLVLTFWERSRALLPLRVFELRYEELVEDPAPPLRALLDFLGLEWDDRVLDHQQNAASRGVISTPSYNQVTEALYRDSRGRWLRYHAQLAPVLPILLPWAERLGYEEAAG